MTGGNQRGGAIRLAATSDIDACFNVSVAAHGSGYDVMIPKRSFARFARRFAPTAKNRATFARVMASRLASADWTFYVATVNGTVVGYHCARRSGETIILRGLFVDPARQGQGIGKQLFEALLDHFAGASLEFKVLKANKRALALYESHGFVHTRRFTPRFFGAAQITMIRHKQG